MDMDVKFHIHSNSVKQEFVDFWARETNLSIYSFKWLFMSILYAVKNTLVIGWN